MKTGIQKPSYKKKCTIHVDERLQHFVFNIITATRAKLENAATTVEVQTDRIKYFLSIEVDLRKNFKDS